ncbi:uncharacterized protein LOC115442410 isoform X2 [Manduca sexta]|uniref:uncharacterized protein LOC115442410 isoform X2 n=1 Tax=Manduca sexta TaxID=7130 RepID=UPI0018908C9C|nr:uncharacterized protein LOC115442410 isoform X2 [Manduca sexta]
MTKLCLTVFTCGYCFYRVHRLQQNGQIAILLRPTKVLFSHKKEGRTDEELRTVVAYQNPFTGDYCIHKSRVGPKGYMNEVHVPDSPDSGVSDEYEPLNLDPIGPQQPAPKIVTEIPSAIPQGLSSSMPHLQDTALKVAVTPQYSDNSVNKSWNWNYTEYQI